MAEHRPHASFLSSSPSAQHFPNVGSSGVYVPHALVVRLSPQLPLPGELGSDGGRRRFWRRQLPVIVHEYQHAVDHVGTVVGRRLLDRLRDAYAAIDAHGRGDAGLMYKLVELHDEQRRFFRRGYFTVRSPDGGIGSPRKWKLGGTIGAAFDFHGRTDESEPILFATFADEAAGGRVARQPLSAAALFEARAVYVELEQSLLLARAEKGGQIEALDKLDEHYTKLVYHPDWTMYSAPAHMVSTQCGVSDLVTAYRLTARLAGVALNVAPDLPLGPSILNGWPEDSKGRARALLDRRDPGMLFACLVGSAPAFAADPDDWLRQTLEKAGFPSLEAIHAAAGRFLTIPSESHGSSWFDPIYWGVSGQGVVNFARLWPHLGLLRPAALEKLGTAEGPIALPCTLVGDEIFDPRVEAFSSGEQVARLLAGEAQLGHVSADFLAACR
jgi:hypothetical protein